MDFNEIFENFGLGLGIVVLLAVVLIVISLGVAIIPGLFSMMGYLLYIIGILAVIVIAIYFVGKFAKNFIK